MNPRSIAARACCLAAISLLAACGGGGGGGGSAPTDYAVRAAQRKLLTQAASWTVSGTANGQAGTLTVSNAPVSDALFAPLGAQSARSQQTFSLQMLGDTSTSTGTYYFDRAGLAVFGTDNGDGTCSVATANTTIPEQAQVGAQGVLYQLDDRGSCASGAPRMGTTTTTWSIEADGSVVLLCLNSTAAGLTGAVNGSLALCVEIGTDGTPGVRARVTIAASGISLVMRNF